MAFYHLNIYLFFADLSPWEPVWMRITLVAVFYAASAAIVGALVPSRWYVALLTAWGPTLMGSLALLLRLSLGAPPGWDFVLPALAGVPTLALVAGYSGMRLSRHYLLSSNEGAS